MYLLTDLYYYQGLSVCSATVNGEKYLLAFGGYNGRYSNEVCYVKYFCCQWEIGFIILILKED